MLNVCTSALLFMLRVYHAFLSVHCSLVVTCWKRANLFALLCVIFLLFVLHFLLWFPKSDVVRDCIDS